MITLVDVSVQEDVDVAGNSFGANVAMPVRMAGLLVVETRLS